MVLHSRFTSGVCYTLNVEKTFTDKTCLQIMRLLREISEDESPGYPPQENPWNHAFEGFLYSFIPEYTCREICYALDDSLTPKENDHPRNKHIFELYKLLKPMFDDFKLRPDDYESRLAELKNKRVERKEIKSYSMPASAHQYLVRKSAELHLATGKRVTASSLLSSIIEAEERKYPVSQLKKA